MALHLIGLGLDLKSISLESIEELKNCKSIYLESYTIDFPYGLEQLEKALDLKIKKLSREEVEQETILPEAKEEDIALLVYGDPFSATTHHQIILSCKKQGIAFHISHNASIINSIAECGLSLYKFGKVCSMPTWKKSYRPTSFIDYLKENESINAHTLLLVDISLSLSDALKELSEATKDHGWKLGNIILCTRLGTKDKKFYYGSLEELSSIRESLLPFCFIIPSELHFFEKEYLESISDKFP